jgi:hypothetical protein
LAGLVQREKQGKQQDIENHGRVPERSAWERGGSGSHALFDPRVEIAGVFVPGATARPLNLQCGLHPKGYSGHCEFMALPSQPVALTAEQIDELNRKLSNMRHDINNHLSLIMAAVELIRTKPQMAERMMATLVEQPPKIAVALNKFTGEFERTLGLSRR